MDYYSELVYEILNQVAEGLKDTRAVVSITDPTSRYDEPTIDEHAFMLIDAGCLKVRDMQSRPLTVNAITNSGKGLLE